MNNKETKSHIQKQIEEIEQLKDEYETMKLTNTIERQVRISLTIKPLILFRLSLARGLTSDLAKISKSPIEKSTFKVTTTPYLEEFNKYSQYDEIPNLSLSISQIQHQSSNLIDEKYSKPMAGSR